MCPDPEVLAAYVDRRLKAVEREGLEAHLAACDACRTEAVGLWRLVKPATRRVYVPGRRRWGWAVAAASIAAAALLALGLSLRRPPTPVEPPRWEVARHIPFVPPPPPPPPLPPREPIVVPAPPSPPKGIKPPEAFVPPAPPPAPAPAPERTKVPDSIVPPTVAAIATLDRAGEGTRVNGMAAANGRGILPDDLLDGAGLLRFPDQTRVELEAGAQLRVAAPERLLLEKGALRVETERPLVVETAHGSARVLGTVFRAKVDTLLSVEVEKGKVELKTKARSITVTAGKSATSAAATLKALPKDETVFSAPKQEGSPLIWPLDLLRVRGDEVLGFDYWVDAQAAQVNMHFWNSTRKLAHEAVVADSGFGKWARFTIKLSELGLLSGDQLGNLYIQGTGGGARLFFVDKLQITRPYSLRPR